MPFLLSKGLLSDAEDVRKFSLTTILKICKIAKELLKPHVEKYDVTQEQVCIICEISFFFVTVKLVIYLCFRFYSLKTPDYQLLKIPQ